MRLAGTDGKDASAPVVERRGTALTYGTTANAINVEQREPKDIRGMAASA